jgi:hypothetical protein
MSTTLADTPATNSQNPVAGQPAGHLPQPAPAPAAGPAPVDRQDAPPALPRRIPDARNAARPGRKAQPPAGPETLRRVLDGLNRL